jgi:hypothetical protein
MPTELSRALLEKTNRSFNASVRNGFDVHETWQGHGTATHEYRSFDGQPIAPMLDDVGSRESNFGVCRDGHFYSASTATLCTSCRTWSCSACDDVDRHASIECPSCTRPVCRRCLSEPHTVFDDQCLICHDRECSQCGRDPEILPCPICLRVICSACRVDELCHACNELTPALEDQLSSLPTGLATAGATILTGSDQNATTVLIHRGDSTESAVIRDGSIDSWVVFGKTEINDMYRLRLHASRELRAQIVPIIESLNAEIPIDAPHVIVQSKRTFHPAWSVDELGKSGRSERSFLNTDPDLAGLVADEFPTITQLPSAANTTPIHVRQAVASMSQPHTVELVMRWHRAGHDTAVTDSGLVSRTLEGIAVHETVGAWSKPETAPTWVSEAWQPAPTVGRHAVADGVEAVTVSMASLIALGVRVDDHSDWYVVSASSEAPAATMLARSIGAPDADEVSAFTDPTVVSRSSVSNATNVSLQIHPVSSVNAVARRQDPRTTMDALKFWLPSVRVVAPELGLLPQKFRISLEQSVQRTRSRTGLLIGVRIEETVTVDNGHVWRHEVNLSPGQTDARRFDSTTRVRRSNGVIDREGHFGAGDVTCPYCAAKICALCTDGLVACDCCVVSICRRCVREPHSDLWLCPACVTLRRPTRSEARQHGRFLSTRHMLISTDSRHTVLVEYAKHRWTRQADDEEKHMIASPAVSKFLSDRLVATDTPPAGS